VTSPTTRLRRTAIALASVALAAAGCSSLHPGSAAVVGDMSVQASTVDDLTSAVCASNQARALHDPASGGKTSTRELRRSILNILVQADVVEQAAASLGVSVTPAAVDKLIGNTELVPAGVSSDVRAQLLDLFHEIARVQLLTAAIGRQQLWVQTTGPIKPHVSDQQATQAGSKFLASYADKIGVDIDPRFGTYTPSGGIAVASGSLSVPVSLTALRAQATNTDAAWISQLPPTQTC
jgi:SurA N-terminal domain